MLDVFYARLPVSSPAIVVISVSMMLFAGFLMTRLTKLLRLPNVTAYIIAGILIGPYVLDLIPEQIIKGTDFLSDIALAFISFGVGEFFRIAALRKNGGKVILITLLESTLASLAVCVLTVFVLHLPQVYCVILSTLAAATAPASTMMTIRQTKAKGDMVDTLLQVIALDNIVALIAYSVAISVAINLLAGSGSAGEWKSVLLPIVSNLGVLALGGLFGGLLHLFMRRKYGNDNRLIIAGAVLFLFCGICSLLEVSPLLGCMSMGMAYINLSKDTELFKQLNYFSPPILLLFFVRSGLNFQLDAFFSSTNRIGNVSLITIALLYLLFRVLGKYAGSFLGCLIVGKTAKVRNFLGLALIPQAGVAIGLAAMVSRLLGDPIGSSLQTIILAASILYEIIGPICAKLALYLSGSYTNNLEELTSVSVEIGTGEPRPPVDVLIERLAQIRRELPPTAQTVSEEEQAFSDAAEEYLEEPIRFRFGRFINRK